LYLTDNCFELFGFKTTREIRGELELEEAARFAVRRELYLIVRRVVEFEDDPESAVPLVEKATTVIPDPWFPSVVAMRWPQEPVLSTGAAASETWAIP